MIKHKEQAWQPKTDKPIKPLKPLTRKQKAFVQELINNPKQSGVQAAIKTYGKPDKPTTYTTANAIARENLQKPAILLELSKHSATAELTVLEVMNTSKEFSHKGDTAGSNYASTALQAANSVLDRLHGKATQKVEQHSTTVTLSLSLKDITLTDDQSPNN